MLLDQAANQQPLSGEIARAFSMQPPAIMGPPTEACSSWLLGGEALRASLDTNVVFDVAQMSGGVVGPEPLSARIRITVQSSQLNRDTLADVLKATNDASIFADRYIVGSQPNIVVTTEGALLLHWEQKNEGTALLFAGDGTVVYSKRDAEFSYSESGIEQSLLQAPPADYRVRISGDA